MSEPTVSHHVLHLVLDGFPVEKEKTLVPSVSSPGDTVEVFALTEATAPEALEKIFAAETIMIWGKVG